MNISVPANIDIGAARLPAAYEQAKTALTNCASIDECVEWANKAEALASYAKQADDDSLRKLADRIQARAVRRCGELLKAYSAGREQGGRPPRNDDGTVSVSQKSAAEDAGMSERQRVTAVRVANVPEPDFTAAVESDAPPTVTRLADMGRQARAPMPEPPAGFSKATHLLGAVRRFAEFCATNEPEFVAGGVMADETGDLREKVTTIDGWLDRFVVNLRG